MVGEEHRLEHEQMHLGLPGELKFNLRSTMSVPNQVMLVV